MFESILYEGTMIIAQVHESIVHLNDDFELVLGDKELHFILMAVLGMLLFFTGTGEMDFRDVVAGLYGVLAFFAVYTVYRLIVMLAQYLIRRGKKADG